MAVTKKRLQSRGAARAPTPPQSPDPAEGLKRRLVDLASRLAADLIGPRAACEVLRPGPRAAAARAQLLLLLLPAASPARRKGGRQ